MYANVKVKHVVYKWGGYDGGWTFNWSPSGYCNKTLFHGCNVVADMLHIIVPIDPLTAISLGLVKPEELGYPAGILAAFNMLKGNP